MQCSAVQYGTVRYNHTQQVGFGSSVSKGVLGNRNWDGSISRRRYGWMDGSCLHTVPAEGFIVGSTVHMRILLEMYSIVLYYICIYTYIYACLNSDAGVSTKYECMVMK